MGRTAKVRDRDRTESTRFILIVDDDVEAGTAMARILEAVGYNVVCAAGSQAARTMISACPIALIITDVFMPGMSGLALIDFIRQRRLGIPIVVKADARWRGALDLGALVRYLGGRSVLPAALSRPALLKTVTDALSGNRAAALAA
jgi:CheY-like chemotaxis protein